MSGKVLTVAKALEDLGAKVEEAGANYSTQTMQETWGWNCPPLTPKQMGGMARNLAEKISGVPEAKINTDFNPASVVKRVNLFVTGTLPYLFNGNGSVAAPLYFGLLQWVDLVFEEVYEFQTDWQKMLDSGQLPKPVAAKLRGYKAQLKKLDVDFETIGERITYINQAHDAAEALPTDLEALRAASDEVTESKSEAEKNSILAQAARDEIDRLLHSIKESEAEARKLVENTEDAYSAATTRGLGEAFQRRADRLAKSMWTWVGGLITALALGAIIGHHRVSVLQDLLSNNAASGAVSFNVLLAVISVAAPVWFAWIATKQIGHRFRLSEDYAFKASVAQAYEGYRREAARIDEKFAKRLFSSALDRIDEAPIRFVENETFGSPLHEFWKLRGHRKLDGGSSAASAPSSSKRQADIANDDDEAA